MVLDDMLHIDLIPNNMYLKTIAMSPLYIDKICLHNDCVGFNPTKCCMLVCVCQCVSCVGGCVRVCSCNSCLS